MTTDSPLVTIILPIHNEARYITRSLGAVLNQDYPSEKIEILVVDGISNDGTRARVDEIAARDGRVTQLDNPCGIVPTALNLGLVHARGEVILRVDGHTIIAPDYVRRCVEALQASDADNVGGRMDAVGLSPMAGAIAAATSSPFGVGSARFHYADTPGWVDTVYLGAYRREVFERIGNFDEELVRNQDDELNFRLIRAGGRIWFDPRIRSQYFSRGTLGELCRQYFQYGFWKVRVMQKHHRPAAWRQLAPGALVLGLAASGGAALALGTPLPFALVAGGYLLGALIAAWWTGEQRSASMIRVFGAFLTMHLGYGAGFWVGVVRWNLAKR